MAKLTPAEIAAAPAVTLGGRKFFIPKLAVKQNRVVVSSLGKILPMVAMFETMVIKGADGNPTVDMKRMLTMTIDDETWGLLLNSVYAACTRGQPEFTRDEFDDMPIGNDEILMALPIVMMQSFAFTKKEAGSQATPGEPSPAPQPAPPQSIGTESSSEPAVVSAGPGST